MEKLSDVIKQVIKDYEASPLGYGCKGRFCDYYTDLQKTLTSASVLYLCSEIMCPCIRAFSVLGYGCKTQLYEIKTKTTIADLKANLKVVLKIEKDNPNVVIT